jgi:SAM-dependent methyltransferase
MEPVEYERMYHAETRHWWYLGMAAITRAILNRYVSPIPSALKILDAGCGTGAAMSAFLFDYGIVTGCDISPLALSFCRARNLTRLARASVMEIPFPADGFDLVTSFDVLYERAVTSDSAALAEFFRVLRPGGFLLLRLPAYNWLRGQHDRAIHTARRYTASQVARLLTSNGFRLAHITYANAFLFPLALAKRLLERAWPPNPDSSDLSIQTGAFNSLFRHILSSEAPLAARTGQPFGLSVIALGQKPIER